jgi:hypothetical protein
MPTARRAPVESSQCRDLGGAGCLASVARLAGRQSGGLPVVSIAKIRGRTRGIGNEFVLACDMRFASAPYSATPRSASDWSRAAERWNGFLDDRFHESCRNEGIHLVFLTPI